MLRALPAAAAAAGLAVCYYKYMYTRRKPTVVITGGTGNLGVKLATHLIETGKYRVVLIEHPDFFCLERVPEGCTYVLGDLVSVTGGWQEALRGADTVVHFSAVNPYPNASWEESAGSMSHIFNIFLAAARHGVRRVVFASSNHVMGGYKDLPDFGMVHPTSPPRCGTKLHNLEHLAKSGDAVAYAAAKLAGEQMGRALAAVSTTTTFAILRIGWCQPGENSPKTLSASGCPPQYQTKVGGPASAPVTDEAIDEAWFCGMWLSNGDFLRYFEAAISVPITPGSPLLVNAMSGNTGARWSLVETKRDLGVTAADDVRKHL